MKQSILRSVLAVFFIVGIAYSAQSQTLVSQYMEEAQSLMYQEQYEEANLVFRKMLALNTTLPEDMSYLFAETLYMLGQYTNAQNFLTKYITITGRTGNYYEEALTLQEQLEQDIRNVVDCEFCNGAGFRLIACNTCHETGSISRTCPNCYGSGKNQCQKCYGEGVLVTLDKLGTRQYATCDNCNGQGIHVCRICNGTKQINSACPTCLGSKQMQSSILCTHEPLTSEVTHEHSDEEGK